MTKLQTEGKGITKIKLDKKCSLCNELGTIGLIDLSKGGDYGVLCQAHLGMFCLQTLEKMGGKNETTI